MANSEKTTLIKESFTHHLLNFLLFDLMNFIFLINRISNYLMNFTLFPCSIYKIQGRLRENTILCYT